MQASAMASPVGEKELVVGLVVKLHSQDPSGILGSWQAPPFIALA